MDSPPGLREVPIGIDLAGYEFNVCCRLYTGRLYMESNLDKVASINGIPITCLNRDHKVLQQVAQRLSSQGNKHLTFLGSFPCLVKTASDYGFRLDRTTLSDMELVTIHSRSMIEGLIASGTGNFQWLHL